MIAVASNLGSHGGHRFHGATGTSLVLIAGGLLCVNADPGCPSSGRRFADRLSRRRRIGTRGECRVDLVSNSPQCPLAQPAPTAHFDHVGDRAGPDHAPYCSNRAGAVAGLVATFWRRALSQSLSGPEPVKFWLLMTVIGFLCFVAAPCCGILPAEHADCADRPIDRVRDASGAGLCLFRLPALTEQVRDDRHRAAGAQRYRRRAGAVRDHERVIRPAASSREIAPA